MLFEDLVDRISPFVLNEKYYDYTIPTKNVKGGTSLHTSTTNEYLMYDFYVLDYLKFLVDNMPPKQFRDLPPDLEASVQDAVNKLFPYLREELLDAVFYAVCAEMRHADVFKSNRELIKDKPKFNKLYTTYLKYVKFHTASSNEQKDVVDLYGVRKPTSDTRTPESERDNDKSRNTSFKAANYAIKKTGLLKRDFI